MSAPKPPRPADPTAQEILVVVFDGEKARFFSHLPNGRLNALNELESGLHRFNREIVSDKPGRAFSSVGEGRSAIEPKHDPHKMEKHNFIHAIVRVLEDALDRNAFESLVVVAPERGIGEFRSLASDKLKRRVWREVPKELTQYSGHELEARLKPHLGPEGGQA